VLDRASKTLPFLYHFYFLKGKDPDGRRSAPSLPENHTSIFKERRLTDFGGAAKMDSNRNCFTVVYRLHHFYQRFILVDMTKDDQR
jgi:hypothetical protein